MQTVAETHAPDDRRGDAFGIRHRFVDRHVVRQIVFVDAPEGPLSGAQAGASPFATVAVDLPNTIPIIITRPFPGAVTDAGVVGMHARIVGRFVRIEDGAVGRDIAFNNRAGG